MIDGLTSVRAARHAGESGRRRRFKARPSQTRLPEKKQPPPPDGKRPAARIGHTAVPQRNELLCYECGYAFVITGRIHNVICPKCHRKLLMEDLSIDSEWARDVKTIGNVAILKGGRLTGGSIVARDVILEGDARQATLQVGRRLELGAGARFDQARATFNELRVRAGARIVLRRAVDCGNIEVEGDLKADARCSGLVRVHAGGCLRGSLRAARLAVADGGGLMARLDVQPQAGRRDAKTKGGSSDGD
jgi:cytoskeletal protein CcmA (bactofilin family)